jgi:hypothetical protein
MPFMKYGSKLSHVQLLSATMPARNGLQLATWIHRSILHAEVRDEIRAAHLGFPHPCEVLI